MSPSRSPVGRSRRKDYSRSLSHSVSPGAAPHRISSDLRARLGPDVSTQARGENNNGATKGRKQRSPSESSLESRSPRRSVSASLPWSLMAETSVIGGDHQHPVPHHQGVGHQVAMLAWFPMGTQVLIHDCLVVLLHTENS